MNGGGRTRRQGGLHVALLLAPALAVVGVFFIGGVGESLAESLGYRPFTGEATIGWSAYRTMWGDQAVRAGLGLTVQIAVVATVAAAVAGMGIALLIRRLRHRRWAAALTQVNLAVPHLVGAFAIMLVVSQTGLISRLSYAAGLTSSPAGFPALTADGQGIGVMTEYIWKEAPFIALLAVAALGRGVRQLEQAGQVLGAGRWQRLRHVTLPAMLPSVAAGSILVFAFTFGSYEVPYLLGRPYPATLPVVAYQYYTDTDLTMRSEAMAITVLITAISLVALVGYVALLARLGRRRL